MTDQFYLSQDAILFCNQHILVITDVSTGKTKSTNIILDENETIDIFMAKTPITVVLTSQAKLYIGDFKKANNVIFDKLNSHVDNVAITNQYVFYQVDGCFHYRIADVVNGNPDEKIQNILNNLSGTECMMHDYVYFKNDKQYTIISSGETATRITQFQTKRKITPDHILYNARRIEPIAIHYHNNVYIAEENKLKKIMNNVETIFNGSHMSISGLTGNKLKYYNLDDQDYNENNNIGVDKEYDYDSKDIVDIEDTNYTEYYVENDGPAFARNECYNLVINLSKVTAAPKAMLFYYNQNIYYANHYHGDTDANRWQIFDSYDTMILYTYTNCPLPIDQVRSTNDYLLIRSGRYFYITIDADVKRLDVVSNHCNYITDPILPKPERIFHKTMNDTKDPRINYQSPIELTFYPENVLKQALALSYMVHYRTLFEIDFSVDYRLLDDGGYTVSKFWNEVLTKFAAKWMDGLVFKNKVRKMSDDKLRHIGKMLRIAHNQLTDYYPIRLPTSFLIALCPPLQPEDNQYLASINRIICVPEHWDKQMAKGFAGNIDWHVSVAMTDLILSGPYTNAKVKAKASKKK